MFLDYDDDRLINVAVAAFATMGLLLVSGTAVGRWCAGTGDQVRPRNAVARQLGLLSLLVLPAAVGYHAAWSTALLETILASDWWSTQLAVAVALAFAILATAVVLGVQFIGWFIRHHQSPEGIELHGTITAQPKVVEAPEGGLRVSLCLRTSDGTDVTLVSDPRTHSPRVSLTHGFTAQRIFEHTTPGSEWRGFAIGDELWILNARPAATATDAYEVVADTGLVVRGGVHAAYYPTYWFVAVVIVMIVSCNVLASELARLLGRFTGWY